MAYTADAADRLVQAEADILALAETLQKLINGIGELKAVQDETLAVMRQLLVRRQG